MAFASDGFVVREAHGNVETLAYRAPYDYSWSISCPPMRQQKFSQAFDGRSRSVV
jgi:hypothetical protein